MNDINKEFIEYYSRYYVHEIYKIEYFIRNGCDINIQDESDRTLLHHVCLTGNLNVVKYLTENIVNIDLNIKNNNGNSPLIEAILGDNYNIVDFLIKKKVDINQQNNSGCTPLTVTMLFNTNYDMIKLLLENGADIFIKDKYNQTPLNIARDINAYDIIKLLEYYHLKNLGL